MVLHFAIQILKCIAIQDTNSTYTRYFQYYNILQNTKINIL